MNNDELLYLSWATYYLLKANGMSLYHWGDEKKKHFPKSIVGYYVMYMQPGIEHAYLGTTLDDVRRFITKLPPKS